MCMPGLDPVSLGMMALSAAGSGVSAYEANQNQRNMIEARNRATQAELARQKQFAQQSRQQFDTSFQDFTPEAQSQQLEQKQGEVQQVFNNAKAADVGSISTADAPRVVADNESRTVGAARGRQSSLGEALARLSGYDQNAFQNKLNLGQSGREIDTIGDFAKTSASISGLEQQAAANNARRSPSGLGDLLSFAGSAGSYYAGKGGFNNLLQPAARYSPAQLRMGTGTGGLY